MTLFLNEKQVEGLLDMEEVVRDVEEAFRRKGLGQAVNSMRTRSRAGVTALNVMHASLPYLGRAGLKCYMSSPAGLRFLVVLFDAKRSTPLAVMGSDMLGRYRTGAASGVATRHLYRGKSASVAIFGAGRQALTQVLALRAVLSLEKVKVWSPNSGRRRRFVARLTRLGLEAREADTPAEAAAGTDVGSTITSAPEPFLNAKIASPLSHINLCGGNHPLHSEITPGAVGSFDAFFVDDLPQAKVEYGDLIRAASAGRFAWKDARELGLVVAGKAAPRGRTLFKSGGVAIEDVAVASRIYDKAIAAGIHGKEFSFG